MTIAHVLYISVMDLVGLANSFTETLTELACSNEDPVHYRDDGKMS